MNLIHWTVDFVGASLVSGHSVVFRIITENLWRELAVEMFNRARTNQVATSTSVGDASVQRHGSSVAWRRFGAFKFCLALSSFSNEPFDQLQMTGTRAIVRAFLQVRLCELLEDRHANFLLPSSLLLLEELSPPES